MCGSLGTRHPWAHPKATHHPQVWLPPPAGDTRDQQEWGEFRWGPKLGSCMWAIAALTPSCKRSANLCILTTPGRPTPGGPSALCGMGPPQPLLHY